MPPAIVDIPSNNNYFERVASYVFQLRANYPWRHGNEDNALTLTFGEDCPQELTVSISSPLVRPDIPTRLKGSSLSLPTFTTVKAEVKTCVAAVSTPTAVPVSFALLAPAAGSADAGGHLHTSRQRKTGTLHNANGQNVDSCVAVPDSNNPGTLSCTLIYRPGIVSGIETITARTRGLPDAQARVTVAVTGLRNLAETQSAFKTFYRLTGDIPGFHADNHWGTQNAIDKTERTARDYHQEFKATVGINDMSLPLGGVFDIHGDWGDVPPGVTLEHSLHRQGTSVDIEHCAVSVIANNPNPLCAKGTGIDVPRRWVKDSCIGYGGYLETETKSMHCEFPR